MEIISESKSNVKIITANVFSGTGKNRFLYKIVKGKLAKAEIKLGLGNYDRVEVLDGISDNDLVARPLDGVELVDGMKVEAIEKKW